MIESIIAALKRRDINAAASSHTDPSRSKTALVIKDLLEKLDGANAYPLTLPDDATLPSSVYQQVARTHVEADGYRLGQIDTWLASVRALRFSQIDALGDQLEDVVSTYPGSVSVEISDTASDYEPEQGQYRAHFELQATTLATAADELPAAFVHAVESDASAPTVMNSVDQDVTEYVAVVLITTQDAMPALRQRGYNALLGMGRNSDLTVPLEYVSGMQLAVAGAHVYWRELYRYQRTIDRD